LANNGVFVNNNKDDIETTMKSYVSAHNELKKKGISVPLYIAIDVLITCSYANDLVYLACKLKRVQLVNYILNETNFTMTEDNKHNLVYNLKIYRINNLICLFCYIHRKTLEKTIGVKGNRCTVVEYRFDYMSYYM
jgi:hypothetical protein